MRLDQDIELVTEKQIRRKDRTTTTVRTSRKVEARLSSPTRAEYYAGAKIGLQPQAIFDVHAFEYEGERQVKHDGKLYSVIRAYTRDVEGLELTELTCEERVAHGVQD